MYLWLTKIPNDKYAVPRCLPIRREYLVRFRCGRLQTLSGRPGGLKKAVGCHNLCGRTRPVAIHSLVGRTPTDLVSREARNVSGITGVRGHTFNQPPKIFCDNLFPCSWEARNVTKITGVRGHTFNQPPKLFCDNLFPCSWEARNVTGITGVRGHTSIRHIQFQSVKGI